MRVATTLSLLAIMALFLSPAAYAAAEPPVRILMLGDGLGQNDDLPSAADFPAQLERTLNMAGLDVRLTGSMNSNTTVALAELDAWLGDGKTGPDAVIVELGSTDGAHGLSAVQTETNLDAILARLKARNIPVLLTGITAPHKFGEQYGREFNALFPRLAGKYGVLFYPIFLDGVDASQFQSGGLHPNEKGVAAIVGNITPLAVELTNLAKARRLGTPATPTINRF